MSQTELERIILNRPEEHSGRLIRASIIIVTYNNAHDINDCLISLQKTMGSDDEVIVVDNQSTDGTAKLVEKNFPWVNLILNPHNNGYGGGCNCGAHLAQGKYLAFLNPDTISATGWLDHLVEALALNPDCGLATPKILLLKQPELINTCGNDINISGLTLCRGMGRPHEDYQENEKVNAVSGAAFMIEKYWFEHLGGFDEDFFLYMEDSDLSLRSRLAGRDCLFVANSLVFHDYCLTFGPHKVFFQERNRWLMLLKNFRPATLWCLSPSLLLAEVITWGYVILFDRHHWRNKIKAYQHIFASRKQIKLKRRKVRELRKRPDRALIAQHTTAIDFNQTGAGFTQKLAGILFRPALFLNKLVFSFFKKNNEYGA